MRKLTSIAALLAMTLGFVACNKENAHPEPDFKAQGYMSVALQMPTGGLRADGQNQTNPDYNFVGKWAGKDKIETVDIYVVPTNTGLELEKHSLAYADYYNEPTKATDGSNNVVLTPKKAVKVGALVGQQVQVYVVLNASPKAKAILDVATSANFTTEYAKVIELSTATEAVATALVTEENTAGGKIAKKAADLSSETIMMTCLTPSPAITLEQSVTEVDAVAGVKNQAKVSVERTVARVMVSLAAETFEIKDKVTNATIGTLKNLRYVIAQGERQVYIQKQSGGNVDLSWKTPGSDFVPTAVDYNTQAANYYDYASLWVDYSAALPSGTIIPTIANYQQDLGTVTGELERSLTGKFLLPNTHKYGATKDVTNYRKGNTPYILVRGTFDPLPTIFADHGKSYTDGTPVPAYVAGQDFYVGTNGKYYVSMRSVRDPQAGGVNGMDANKYVNGKVLYFAWLNPDVNDATKWLNSPVVRNNIYHVHISGFKSIGVNWNPLVPDPDPSNPANPNNPDPNPNEPGDDPNDNPIKPEDPLSNDETYMSVEVTILPWLVHTYSVQLGF
ncbi:MAG: Mfa1 family fimbria major subunit [Bacteroidales bacterium]|uniref:Mfa1 family fimbria major subunit n=1 Tax=Porphyromonas sp. TaxID=1924944 RepID=UPI002977111B|nr:Mfa1 family fimbria major subunit [Porphyromonas sp.]MDD7438083.1 Mfa1 family fimbria major subunit [Bacteroidales bacterium]MDY3067399.1 Mfa1 family fimbria major subunit [Porphyromonas sp.]